MCTQQHAFALLFLQQMYIYVCIYSFKVRTRSGVLRGIFVPTHLHIVAWTCAAVLKTHTQMSHVTLKNMSCPRRPLEIIHSCIYSARISHVPDPWHSTHKPAHTHIDIYDTQRIETSRAWWFILLLVHAAHVQVTSPTSRTCICSE